MLAAEMCEFGPGRGVSVCVCVGCWVCGHGDKGRRVCEGKKSRKEGNGGGEKAMVVLEQTTTHTNKDIIANLHGVIIQLAATNPSRGFNDTARADNGALSDADGGSGGRGGRRRPAPAAAGRLALEAVQVAAQVHVGHDDRLAAERDVRGAADVRAPAYFVAAVLGCELVRVRVGGRW